MDYEVWRMGGRTTTEYSSMVTAKIEVASSVMKAFMFGLRDTAGRCGTLWNIAIHCRIRPGLERFARHRSVCAMAARRMAWRGRPTRSAAVREAVREAERNEQHRRRAGGRA